MNINYNITCGTDGVPYNGVMNLNEQMHIKYLGKDESHQ